MKAEKVQTGTHTNPDAITGAPGSHPGATGIGAASGAATGAAIGALGGPIGAVIGAVAGGAVGGWTGHALGEWNDPSDETYWRDEYPRRSYYDHTANFDQDVAPALQYGGSLGISGDQGVVGANRPLQPTYDMVEEQAQRDWENVRGKSKFSYDQARPAISDAYNRKVQQRGTQTQNTI